ncbi:glucan 1,4-alpha-glucosidase [candidate division GN15 bacterium]|uniref:Glucan 1,4-alpha-glucosidase n=1 Tax=candidate division GN15 bacterium TaxID=2072418 RepID=A0A855X7K4_9BACT|nr:MAG: glucan 1,4-alpha-glucosidase [candidate division GN15 bacterium]
MSETISYAFGQPGIPPRWTSSAKSGIGTAISGSSRVWFTLSHGIFNEIYYPRIDQACTRDMGMIVTDGKAYFSEEKRHAASVIDYLEPAIPAYRLVSTCRQGRYRLEKEIIADPTRDVVLQRTRFVPSSDAAESYLLHVLLAPHLGNCGAGNTGWLGDYKGRKMLFAERGALTLALAASVEWNARSVGFVGFSDGWQDLTQHKKLLWQFDRAENGNIALVGELDWRSARDHTFVIAVGFGTTAAEAGHRVNASLLDDFDELKARYVQGWRAFYSTLPGVDADVKSTRDLSKISAMVLRAHEAKRFPGGMIASLSIPWGFNKGDEDLGGYHLVWPRDAVESATGLLSIGAHADARRVLKYLQSTQEVDGHWPQNMWLDGTPYWSGSQMDETAFPILLVDLAFREKALEPSHIEQFWPMIRRASQFIVCNGPVTQQDRWEEDPGYSPFTLAVEIAALLAAADFAELAEEAQVAVYLRETADAWNAHVESWTYVADTDLAHRNSVNGYYVRIAPPEVAEGASPKHGFVPIKNRPIGSNLQEADYIISPDALALVRFGLRAADDPRIRDTIKMIDSLLKLDTPYGPIWHRYNADGYGEHEDGRPFDGTGIGRAWPLLSGERGHYELAAGKIDDALTLLKAMEGFANETGLIPEQTWDTDSMEERGLRFARPSGSAMPLVWAHAEYLKLRRSIADRKVFDMPTQAVQRYQVEKVESRLAIWRFNQKCRTMPPGWKLRIETLRPAVVHWGINFWRDTKDSKTRDTGLGMHVVDLDTGSLAAGDQVDFTFYWPDSGEWEGKDFSVTVDRS